MKRIYGMMAILMALLMVTAGARAQTTAEWLRQKQTQKKYLLEQIAALKIYTGYLQKGYTIAKDGLKTISDFKQGELSVHDTFFKGLALLNPRVKNYGRVAEIALMQTRILSLRQNTLAALRKSGLAPDTEMDYRAGVYGKLLEDCAQLLEELLTVTTDRTLEMKDDERIRRIDQLHADMEDNLRFCKKFSDETKVMVAAKDKAKREITNSRIINGIKD